MHRVLCAKYLCSRGRFFILFCILTLVMVFVGGSFQVYTQSVQSAKKIEEETTTVAIPHTYLQKSKDGQLIRTDVTEKQLQQLYVSDSILNVHGGISFSGYSDKIRTVVPASNQFNDAFSPKMTTENVGVFRIRCERILADGERYIRGNSFMYYDVEASLMEVLYLKEGFYWHQDVPLTLNLCRFVDDQRQIPFEEGKEYIVTGFYNPPLAQLIKNKVKGMFYGMPDPKANPYLLCSFRMNFGVSVADMPFNPELIYRKIDNVIQFAYMDSDYPVILQPEDSRVEAMVDLAEFNSNLLLVTAIDTIEAVPYFTLGDAYITLGRSFTDEEVQTGTHVCIISENLARANGIDVGDSFVLDLYENYMTLATTMPGQEELMVAEMSSPREALASKSYTVVGLYKAPEWYSNRYAFNPNTVFINKSSISSLNGSEGLPFVDSIVLRNGSNEQFVLDLEKAEISADAYSIYDGGYTEYMESLQMMRRDTGIVLIVCTFLFTVVSFSALTMMVLHLKRDTEIMQKIGATQMYSTMYIWGCVLPVIVAAAIISYAVCCLIHAPMMELLETWYTFVKPKYSVMAESQGVLKNTVAHYPSPYASGLSVLIQGCMLFILTLNKRRRKG